MKVYIIFVKMKTALTRKKAEGLKLTYDTGILNENFTSLVPSSHSPPRGHSPYPQPLHMPLPATLKIENKRLRTS